MTKITIPLVGEDQGRTLEDLLDMGKYFDEVVQIEHSSKPTITVRMASPYSWYRGAYTYGPEFTIEADGSFIVEGADEVLRDELDLRFTIEDDSDPFVSVYRR